MKRNGPILIRRIIELIRGLWGIAFLRFLMVGGINTLFSYAVFAVLIVLGLHYVFAALLATICGIMFNFKTTGTLVFKNRDNRLIFRFFGVYVIVYLLNIGLLRLFGTVGVGSLVAGAVNALPIAAISFLLMRNFVFQGTLDSTQAAHTVEGE